MNNMFEGMRVVEFIVLLVERIASRFRGVIVSHEIATDSSGKNFTISLVFCLPKKQNVTLQSWFRAAMQVFGLSQRLWKREPTCGRDSTPSVNTPPPLPLVSAHCGQCRRSVDPITGWALGRAWPPLGVVCLVCFGSSACDGAAGESQSSTGLAKSDEGGIADPSILVGSRKPLEHVRGTSPSVILGGTASKARGLVGLALDAPQVRYMMPSQVDSLSKVGRGRNHKKNLRRRRRQQEMRRIVRSLGLGIGASRPNMVPRAVVPDHVHQEAVQHAPITNSLEEGQILMDDDDSLKNMLKEIDRWN